MGALRYFHFKDGQYNDKVARLFPDNDDLALGDFRNIHILHRFPDDSALVQVWIEQNVIDEIETALEVPFQDSDALLNIAQTYVGRDRADIEARFPELAGQVEVTDEMDTRMVDKLVLPVPFGTI